MLRSARLLRAAAFVIAASMATDGAEADEGLVLYGAGSLRETMTEIAQLYSRQHGVSVRAEFGASGRMRERIEAGETVDVFTSAALGHARSLVDAGRASLMAMFAQNTLCLLASSRFGAVSTETALDALLRPGIKIGVSPAKIDPLGDYTVALFEAVEKMHAGSGASLHAKSVVLDNPPGAPPTQSGDYVVDALAEGRVDLAIVYCSGRERYTKLASDAAFVTLPQELQVGPQYGLALMKEARPGGALLALTVLSPEGQAILARGGFKPVGLPTRP